MNTPLLQPDHKTRSPVFQSGPVLVERPNSPDFNSSENLWRTLKSHSWSNRTYRDHNELEKAVIHAWKEGVAKAEPIKTAYSAKI